MRRKEIKRKSRLSAFIEKDPITIDVGDNEQGKRLGLLEGKKLSPEMLLASSLVETFLSARKLSRGGILAVLRIASYPRRNHCEYTEEESAVPYLILKGA